MDIISGILRESYVLLMAMSPYLLFGYLFAGVLHIFIDTKTVSRHLGKGSFFSVIKASLFGIPLPLCSCSVIPAAMSLRREGASRGAVLSFLISAPTTGIDSIFATYSLLGMLFMVYRVAASFITGVFAGIIANIFIREKDIPAPRDLPKCKMCDEEKDHDHGVLHKIGGVLRYAFGDILGDTGKPLITGILIGGVIAFFLPEEFIGTYLGSGIKAIIVMLIAGIPMYVCATASIPIAAALLMKGINPGAAFAFLVAGPATNIVTISVVGKSMGGKALIVYLGSIVVCSIVMGLFLDQIYVFFHMKGAVGFLPHQHGIIPDSISIFSSVVLIMLVTMNIVTKKFALFGKKA